MKYSNWKQVFTNDPNNDNLNTQAETIINLTIDTFTEDECKENIKKEPGFLSFGLTPITNEVQVFHHVTSIGGTLAHPSQAIIGMMGFTGQASALQFPPDLFSTSTKVKVPKWSTLQAITTPDQVLTTTAPARNASSMVFRPILHVPPLLQKPFIECLSPKAEHLFVACLATIKAFDASLDPAATTPKATDSCKRVLFFLWCMATKAIDPVVTVTPSSPFILDHHKAVHELHVLPSGAIPPSAAGTTAPSAATFTALAGAVSNLTNHLEKTAMRGRVRARKRKTSLASCP